MNKYFKEFLHRGLCFSGFGPIILAIIYFILSKTVDGFALNASQVLIGTLSIYLLAFVQAGASVFNQIEGWPISKSLLCHFSTLYLAYVCCYLLNTWIPFDIMVIVLFTIIFVASYLIVWLIVYLSLKATSKKFNKKL